MPDTKSILLIDDEQAILLSTAAMLEDKGFIVYTASCGEEGVQTFHTRSPDMVMVDLNMPGMKGTEIIAQIRKVSPNTPLIVISGIGQIEAAVETFRIGAWDFLHKPVRLPTLLHTVEKAFERQHLLHVNERYQQNLEAQIIAHTEKLVLINESLKISEERYRNYIEKSPDAIFVMAADGKILEVNNAALKLTGYSKEELLERDPSITPEYAKKHWGHLFTHLQKKLRKNEQHGELLFITKNEVVVWLGSTVARMPKGEIIGYFRDITERKIAEKESRKRQETQQMQKDLAAWLSVCPNLEIAAQDVLGQLAWLQEIDCGSLFLLTPEGKLDLIAQHNVDTDFWAQISQKSVAYIEDNIGEHLDAIYLSSDQILDYMGQPAIDHGIQFAGIVPLRFGGETEAVICIASKTVNSVSDATKEVVESVAALTSVAISRLMAEEEMKKARLHAEDASRLKSSFVSNVSHELRTPLNGIIGFSEFILASKSLDEAHENAATIIRESDVLLRLINGLLDHAKMEEGKLELNPEIMNLHSLLDDIARTSFLQAHKKGLEFELYLDPGLPKYILGDSLRIRQIINNFVSNALKFTDKGSVDIHADVLEQNDNETSIRFSVKDTGIGIPKSRQKAIFNSFVQADSGTARKYGGSGLGTTIALQLVKLMNGQLGLESEPQKGSEFWFTASFKTPEYKDMEQPYDNTSVREIHPDNLANGKILIAEDYLINQKVICNHLDSEGMRSTVVENGEQAVDICNKERFSLILMDVNMPVMDGVEATTIIRAKSEYNQKTPILALTASAEPETREACLKAGMNDVITKPIKRDIFLGAVLKWFVHRLSIQPEHHLDAVVQTTKDVRSIALTPTKTTTESSSLQLLDAELLLRQFGGNKQLASTMIDHFKQALPMQIRQMENAISEKNLEVVRSEAHKIKGGAGSIAAFLLMDVAKRLESAAKAGGINDTSTLLDEFKDGYSKFKEVQLH